MRNTSLPPLPLIKPLKNHAAISVLSIVIFLLAYASIWISKGSPQGFPKAIFSFFDWESKPSGEAEPATVTYQSLFNNSSFDSKTVNISLPVGKIGASSNVNLTGASTYSIPFSLPPGIKGLTPQLGVAYNSQLANGLLGIGWNLNGISMVQRTRKDWYHEGETGPITTDGIPTGPLTIDGQRLIAVNGTYGGNGTEYRTERESFSRIKSYGTSGNGPAWFLVETKSGLTHQYGNPSHARFKAQGSNSVLIWAINKSYDQEGNYIQYKYLTLDRELLVDQILYYANSNQSFGPLLKVDFTYDDRYDPNTHYINGSSIKQNKLLTRVSISSRISVGSPWIVEREYTFSYGKTDLYSHLVKVREYGRNSSYLNETIFQYGSLPTEMQTVTSGNWLDSPYDGYIADMDGDGLSDLIRARYEYFDDGSPNWPKYYTDLEFYRKLPNSTGYSYWGQVSLPSSFSILPKDQEVPDNISFDISDFDGDGRDEFMIEKVEMSASGGGGFLFTLDFAKIYEITPSGQVATMATHDFSNLSYNHFYGGNQGHMLAGDFDGDGRSDYLNTLTNQQNGYRAFLSFPGEGVYNELVEGDLGGDASPIAFSDNAYVLDFDGDGKTEVMITKDALCTIYSFSQNSSGQYEADVVYTSGYPTKWHEVRIGDFNGDGKSDIFTENGAGFAEVAYSTGKQFEAQVINMSVSPDFSLNNRGFPNHLLRIADINADGKTDIFHLEGDVYDYYSYENVDIHIYYSNGLSFLHKSFDLPGIVSKTWDIYPGDFNGDGGTELYFRNEPNGSNDKYFRFRATDKSRLLHRISDGFDLVTEFSYAYMTETGGIYNGGSSVAYPLVSKRKPILLVDDMKVPNGIGGTRTVNYSYQGTTDHYQGRGWLGFESVTSTDYTAGIRTVQQFSIDPNFFISLPIQSDDYRLSNNQHLSQRNSTYAFIQPGTSNTPASPGSERFVFQLVQRQLNDLVKGSQNTTNWYHDLNGNLYYQITDRNGVEIEYAWYYNFSSNGTWLPTRPQGAVTWTSRNGSSSNPLYSCYSYDSNGKLLSHTKNCNSSEPLLTSYTYNNYGLIASETISSPGLTSRASSFGYDAQQRILTVTDVIGTTTTTKDFWGNTLSETSPNGNVTSFQYDDFGRMTSATDFLGNTTTYNTSFVNSTAGRYQTYVNVPGGADKSYYYDIFGRETYMDVEMYQNGQWATTKTTYDAKGNIATRTLPYPGNQTGPQVTNTFTYDFFNRVTHVDHGPSAAGHTSYTYSYGPNGQSTVTKVNPDGASQTKVSDVTGLTLSLADPGGTVTMTYTPRGQMQSIYHNGNLRVTMNYHPTYDRQTSLYEANTGTTSYQYNAYGELISQTDANGQQITMQYDPAGRIVQKSTPEGTTTYNYYSGGSARGLVHTIYGPTSAQDFSYDGYGRLQTEQTQIDGSPHDKTFGYDSYGRVNSVDYASGFGIRRYYNARGYLSSVTDHTGSEHFFTAINGNAFGQYTQYSRGNGKTTTNTFDVYGLLDITQTPGVQHLNNSIDPSTGNLDVRFDAVQGKSESFSYDNLNRLSSYLVGGQSAMNVQYDNDGNILTKSDVGTYSYNSSAPHAVTSVTDAQDLLPYFRQDIAYNSGSNPTNITEDGYQLDFTYGADQDQRVKTVLTAPNGQTRTRYYFGNYEKQVTSSGTQHIHYVQGGDGLCAIVVRENGQDSYYYAYTDHLGSILTLTNDAGSVIYEQNFDPWGRRRNPTAWNYNNVPSAPDWLYRGFTGHEEFPTFGLVHMNGRMYDPFLGRMLSADNFVQDKMGSQGFNRYAYVSNNPLKYTDPTGEFIVEALMIGAFANIVIQGWTGNAQTPGDFLKAGIIGGIAGAAGAVTGGLVMSAMPGAGFIYGFTAGFTGGFTSGLITGFGNSYYLNGNDATLPGEALVDGLKEGLVSGLMGGVIAGTASGIQAVQEGRRFWDGALVNDVVLVNQNIPTVQQAGEYNCGPACVEGVDQSLGGNVTQVDARNWFGGDPNVAGIPDQNLWNRYAAETGRNVNAVNAGGGVNPQQVAARMQNGDRIVLSQRLVDANGGANGHSIVLNSAVQRTVTKYSGRSTVRLLFTAMDPSSGTIVRTNLRAVNMFIITP